MKIVLLNIGNIYKKKAPFVNKNKPAGNFDWFFRILDPDFFRL
jgi:hypothetical protein